MVDLNILFFPRTILDCCQEGSFHVDVFFIRIKFREFFFCWWTVCFFILFGLIEYWLFFLELMFVVKIFLIRELMIEQLVEIYNYVL
jgi:hypothetical protein